MADRTRGYRCRSGKGRHSSRCRSPHRRGPDWTNPRCGAKCLSGLAVAALHGCSPRFHVSRTASDDWPRGSLHGSSPCGAGRAWSPSGTTSCCDRRSGTVHAAQKPAPQPKKKRNPQDISEHPQYRGLCVVVGDLDRGLVDATGHLGPPSTGTLRTLVHEHTDRCGPAELSLTGRPVILR